MVAEETTVSLSRDSAEALLYQEGRLLDEGKLKEWVDLFTDDGLYWIPSNQFQIDPKKHVCVVYADKPRLREFLVRADSKTFWAQQPASRTSRLIGNVQMEGPSSAYHVQSRFVITEVRSHRVRILSGTYLHRLAWVEGGWKIREKLVQLLHNDEPLDNLTFML